MIQADFHRVIGAKGIRFSGGQFRFGIKSFHDAAGEPTFGAEPVEQEFAVSTEHPATRFIGSICEPRVRAHQ